jgi:hypothetical protein
MEAGERLGILSHEQIAILDRIVGHHVGWMREERLVGGGASTETLESLRPEWLERWSSKLRPGLVRWTLTPWAAEVFDKELRERRWGALPRWVGRGRPHRPNRVEREHWIDRETGDELHMISLEDLRAIEAFDKVDEREDKYAISSATGQPLVLFGVRVGVERRRRRTG